MKEFPEWLAIRSFAHYPSSVWARAFGGSFPFLVNRIPQEFSENSGMGDGVSEKRSADIPIKRVIWAPFVHEGCKEFLEWRGVRFEVSPQVVDLAILPGPLCGEFAVSAGKLSENAVLVRPFFLPLVHNVKRAVRSQRSTCVKFFSVSLFSMFYGLNSSRMITPFGC